MSRSAWRNLLLLLVFLGLGGAALTIEKPFAERSKEYVEYGPLFPGFEPTRVWGIRVTRGEGEADVQRTQAGWVVTSLYDYPANFTKIQEVVGRVWQWRNDLAIGKSPAKFDKMAVNKQQGTFVSLRDRSGASLVEFYAGRIGGFDPKRLPPGKGIDPDAITFYVRPVPGDEVYLINEFLLGTLTFQPENWIERQAFHYSQEDLVLVEIEKGQDRLVIRGAGEDWTLDGMEYPIDVSKVGQVVSSLGTLVVADVADPSRPLSDYGLDSPRWIATATLKDGRKVRLLIGADKDDRQTYGMVENGRYPVLFLKANLDRVFLGKDDLIRKALALPMRQATSITLEDGGQRVVLERDGGAWKVSSPAEISMDPAVISKVVSSMGRLEHEGYVESSEDLSRFGLDPPAYRATIQTDEESQHLLVGSPNEEGLLFARMASEGWIFLLSGEAFASIRLPLKKERGE
ncbi:MAG: DUF4340 domain-containing protein [Planctomycetota bacterium]|nr:DUF4340 domain-containing protein [Planctomycetota bacterium]